MKKRSVRLTVLGGAALGVLLMASQGARAEASADGASEIVVTGARLRNESTAGAKTDTPLIETPQSITVVDRAQLDLLVVGNLNQALYFTAGVGSDTRGDTAGRYDLLTLRGFTPDQYLDGLRLIGSNSGYAAPQIDITRLDRIDIVKGPASVLYGQASPGGIVALASKLPTAQSFGQVELTGGSYGTVGGSFDIGGPLNRDGTLLFRLDGMASRSDTQIDHTEAQRVAISPALTWKPDAKTTWTLLYNYQKDPKAGAYGSAPPEGSLLPNPLGKISESFNDDEPAYERFRRQQNAISSFFTRDLGGGWTFHQNTRFMRIETSYRSVYSYGLEADNRTLDRFTAATDEAVDALTLDNQITGTLNTGPITHSVIVGVDYQHTGQTEAAGFGSGVGPIDIFNPVYGSPVTDPAISFNIRLNLEQTGVYAQDQIALGHFRLMLSGRYDWVDSQQYDKIALANTDQSESKFTGRAGLLYLFDNGLAPYVSYSTSFQPQTGESFAGTVLAPTEGKQTEVGVKYQPKLWNTLLTASLYDLTQTNVATGDNAHPGFSIAAGEVRSRGLELEGHSQPLPELQLVGSYTYLDNIVTKDNSGLVSARPYGVPQQTANGFGVYTWRTGLLAGFGLGGGVRYIGHSFNGVVGAGAFKIPGATVYDLLATYDFSRLNPTLRGVTANLNVSNLFAARYISSCYSNVWCWYGPQQSAQATLRYRW